MSLMSPSPGSEDTSGPGFRANGQHLTRPLFCSSPKSPTLSPDSGPACASNARPYSSDTLFPPPEEDDGAETVNIAETPLASGLSYRSGVPSTSPREVPSTSPHEVPSTSPPEVPSTFMPHFGTMPRHGFPQSHSARVASAESQFHRTLSMQQLQLCEQQWGNAVRGIQMLAHAIPAQIHPLRRLARKYGIPPHIRGIMWLTFTGVATKTEENEAFCAALISRFGTPDADIAQCIEKDLVRTFPEHPLFGSNLSGIQRLRRVLYALSWRNPLVGYCQGFNFMAALLLLFLDDEEATFWTMCHILEQLLPNDYYAKNLIGIRTDQYVFGELIRIKMPKLAAHFDRVGFDPGVVVPTWLMSLFVGVLPISGVVPLWDYFLSSISSNSPTVIPLAICLALLRTHQEAMLAQDDPGELLVNLTQLAQCTCNGIALVKVAHEFKLEEELVRGLRRKYRTKIAQELAQRQADLRRAQYVAATCETHTSESSFIDAQASMSKGTKRLPGSSARNSFGISPTERGAEAGFGSLSQAAADGEGEEMGEFKATSGVSSTLVLEV